MKKFAVIFGIFTLAFLSVSTYAKDDFGMPQPVANPMLESMVGTWVGEGDMMGNKMKDTLKFTWQLNHQFLVAELKSVGVNDPSKQYQGIGVFGVDSKNNLKTWWFDVGGADTVSTGSGVIQNTKLVFQNGNDKFKEQRSFAVNGNTMVMTAEGAMEVNGKLQPFKQTVTYQKASQASS